MVMAKSEQIRIGLQKSFWSGKSAKASTIGYGYRITPSGELSVDSAEAKIVTFIFERFSKGDSLGKISDALVMGTIPLREKRFGAVKQFQSSWQMKNIQVMLF